MMGRTQFIFIYQLLTITSTSFATIWRYQDFAQVREIYYKSYDQRQLQTDPFYNADVKIKTAVCDAIFSNPTFRREYSIYLNKNAIFHQGIPGETHDVIVDSKESTKIQHMFPCYGRHDPMMSGWDIDDNYEFIYLSEGPYENSVFLYHRERRPSGNDRYKLWEIIGNIDLSELRPVTITPEETNIELESLHRVTITNISQIIETNFIRNIINGLYTENIIYPICDLGKEQKLALCKIVVEQIKKVEKFSFELSEEAYELLPSVTCIKKNITFHYYYKEVNDVERDMFTCYGKEEGREISSSRLQLSDGYYQNTVLAFLDQGNNRNRIIASVHNLDIQNMLNTAHPSSSSGSV